MILFFFFCAVSHSRSHTRQHHWSVMCLSELSGCDANKSTSSLKRRIIMQQTAYDNVLHLFIVFNDCSLDNVWWWHSFRLVCVFVCARFLTLIHLLACLLAGSASFFVYLHDSCQWSQQHVKCDFCSCNFWFISHNDKRLKSIMSISMGQTQNAQCSFFALHSHL